MNEGLSTFVNTVALPFRLPTLWFLSHLTSTCITIHVHGSLYCSILYINVVDMSEAIVYKSLNPYGTG